VILVFPSTSLVAFQTTLLLSIVVNLRHHIAVLTVQGVLELHLRSITLHCFLFASRLSDSISVDIVKHTVRVIGSEFGILVILSIGAWRDGPCFRLPGVSLFVPAGTKFNHRFAFSVPKLIQKFIEFVIQENVFVAFDLID